MLLSPRNTISLYVWLTIPDGVVKKFYDRIAGDGDNFWEYFSTLAKLHKVFGRMCCGPVLGAALL